MNTQINGYTIFSESNKQTNKQTNKKYTALKKYATGWRSFFFFFFLFPFFFFFFFFFSPRGVQRETGYHVDMLSFVLFFSLFFFFLTGAEAVGIFGVLGATTAQLSLVSLCESQKKKKKKKKKRERKKKKVSRMQERTLNFNELARQYNTFYYNPFSFQFELVRSGNKIKKKCV